MFKRLIIIFLILSFTSCATYHTYTKAKAIEIAKKNSKKNNVKIIIEDNNKVLKVLTRDSNYQKLDEIYEFDDNGNNIKYKLVASCDSCFKKYFLLMTTSKVYKWKQLNDSVYVSKRGINKLLNIHQSIYTYEIIKN